jgi:allantoicase
MLNQEYLREDVVNPRQFDIALHVLKESGWKALVPFARLRPDTYHRFTANADAKEVSHLLYMHFPNGGIHGLKAYALLGQDC